MADDKSKLKENEKHPSESSLLKELKMDLVQDSVTPNRMSRRKETLELAGKTGNKWLDQLKVDMVSNAFLPSRGKRRAEDNTDERQTKRIKATPVAQVPSKQKAFSNKIFKRIQGGDITKSEGHNQLLIRVPGLTFMGFAKEYNKWIKENPIDKVIVENNVPLPPIEVNEVSPELDSSKKVSIRLTNILASSKQVDETQQENLSKLNRIKSDLAEILNNINMSSDEVNLLNEIQDLLVKRKIC